MIDNFYKVHIRTNWSSLAYTKLCSSPTSTSQQCSHSLPALFICKKDFSLTSVSTYGLFLQGRESALRIDVSPNSIPHNSLKMILCINTSGSSLFGLNTHSVAPKDCKNMKQVLCLCNQTEPARDRDSHGLMLRPPSVREPSV